MWRKPRERLTTRTVITTTAQRLPHVEYLRSFHPESDPHEGSSLPFPTRPSSHPISRTVTHTPLPTRLSPPTQLSRLLGLNLDGYIRWKDERQSQTDNVHSNLPVDRWEDHQDKIHTWRTVLGGGVGGIRQCDAERTGASLVLFSKINRDWDEVTYYHLEFEDQL